jgi:[acyl-carrier-protein] S-malonyltransferase
MKLAFVFPGQGSQSIGMMSAMAAEFTHVEDYYNKASEILGYDLWNIVCNGPAEELNKTHITQPAMLTAGVATWKIWLSQGGAMPEIMAGHSLGEYTALVCAEAISFEDAVLLVAERGQLMQAAVPSGTGGMAAILGLEDDKVREVCKQAAENDVVQAVNFNSPGQVVIAGSKAAVERAIIFAKEAGAKRALPLPVSVPSHCDLMRPAAEKLAARLQDISIDAPVIPVLHNYDVTSHSDAAQIRNALTMQLYNPVRWVETIGAMASQGIDTLVEAGPGKVLVGLNKRIDKAMTASAVVDPDTLKAALV